MDNNGPQPERRFCNCSFKKVVKFSILYFLSLLILVLIFTALTNEPMNDEQKKWWWAFIGSLLLEGALLMASLLTLHLSDQYKVSSGIEQEDTKKSPIKVNNPPEPSTSTSYKTILTINSIPTSVQHSKKQIKTLNLAPQQLQLPKQKSHQHQNKNQPPSYKFGQALVLQKVDNSPDGYMKSGINSPNAGKTISVTSPTAKDTSPAGTPRNAGTAALMNLSTIRKSPTTVIDLPKINAKIRNSTNHTTKPIKSSVSPQVTPSSIEGPANMASLPSVSGKQAKTRDEKTKRRFKKLSMTNRPRKKDKDINK